jgi:hypothetical protein
VLQLGGAMKIRFLFYGLFGFLVLSLAATILISTPVLFAQDKNDTATNTNDVLAYRVGGTPIVIPPPTNDLVETGQDYRVVMEFLAPEQNRLVAAFVLPSDLAIIKSGGKSMFSEYALVEVLRRGEFMEVSAKDYKDVADRLEQQFGTVLDTAIKEGEDELNHRLKAMKLDDAKISLDKPVQLGCFFSKPDAYGTGIIMQVTKNENTTNVVTGIIFLRVKNRMLFAYLYSVYKDQETVKWVRKTTEDWADAILKANEQ